MSKIISFIKQEIVLIIASILAIISCFFVPISKSYIEYIDFRVLSILFCLMLIVSGLRYVDFFYVMSEKLFNHARSVQTLVIIFILLCFFSSMFITNDVALILFVPFSIYSLKEYLNSKQFIILIVLETISANLGSMFTPIGNPQNLYLFSAYEINILTFFRTMAPYTICSLIVLLLFTFIFKNLSLSKEISKNTVVPKSINYKLHYTCYFLLFFITILTVARFISYQFTLIVCIATILLINSKLFLSVDYCLLITFVAFFVFVGNLGEIDAIKNFITQFVEGNEFFSSIIASQFISNVPAALLLSGFTQNGTALLIGTNIGGLGTMIASMASLISYKFYSKEKGSSIPAYFLWFSIFNVIFLIVLICLYKVL